MSTLKYPEAHEYALSGATERDRLYLQFDLLRDRFREGFSRALVRGNVDLDRPWRALDVACGEGLYAAELVDRYPLASVVGFDRDVEAITTARLAFGAKSRLAFHVADVHQAIGQVVGTDFDVAFMQFGLSHFKFGKTALRQVYDVLRPGGALALLDATERNFSYPHPSSEVFAQALRAAWPSFGTPAAGDHQVALLAEAGFVDITTEPHDYPVGGRSQAGRANLNNLLLLLGSLRTALTERIRTISAEDFDLHLGRLKAAIRPDLEGMSWFRFALARKPG